MQVEPAGASGTAAVTPKNRGPKPGHETAARVAQIIAAVAHNDDWKNKLLEEVCSALDKAEPPYPKTQARNAAQKLGRRRRFG